MKPIIVNLTRPKGDPKIVEAGPSSLTWADRVARDLGWISIGLGLTQIFAANRLSRAVGLTGSESMMRAFGVREIGSGVVTLSTERSRGLWMRVVGDLADIAALTRALNRWNPQRQNAKIALTLVLGITALDVFAATTTARQQHRPSTGHRSYRSYRDRSGYPKGLHVARAAQAEPASSFRKESACAQARRT